MGKPHPIELRVRVVAFVNEGHSNREAARHFRVSPRFVNNMMVLHRSVGALAAAKQSHPPGSKLSPHGEWISERVALHGEVTLDELCVELAERGIEVHRATVGRFLHRLGLSNKKSLKASEQRRPQIAKARDLWINRRKRFFSKALSRLIFIDETSTNIRLTKRTGWSRKGSRLNAYAPFGPWKTQTFIAGLRCHGLTAPWIVNAPMNSRIFETWIDTQLAPTLSPGDVVILDNVGFHKSERAEQLVKAKRAWLLPATLFAGPEPNRDGVLKTQGAPAKACSSKLRDDHPSPRRHHQPLLSR